DGAADHRAEAIGIGELDLDGVPERIELEARAAERDLRAGLDVDVVDAQLRDVRAVRRIEIAEAIAAIVEPDLAVQAGDLRIGQLHVVAAPRADADHLRFDVTHEPGIGPRHDLHADT